MSDTPSARYEARLAEHPTGKPVQILTGPTFGSGPYQLFHVAGAPPGGAKLLAAAASTTDVVLADDLTRGWGPFLSATAPSAVQDQVGWLKGAWASLAPSRPVAAQVLARDEKAKRYVVEPSLERKPDGTLVFEAWYGEPPSFDPFRFRVEVAPSGAATAAVDPLWKLP